MITPSKRREVIAALADKAYRDAYVAAEINTTLPFQIRATRDKRGLTQADLAARTGQDQRTISQFENPNYGKLTLTSLKRLASALDVALVVRLVPFSELIDWTTTVSSDRMAVPAFDEDKGLADDATTSSQHNYVATVVSGATVVSTPAAGKVWPQTALAPVTRMIKATRSGFGQTVSGAASAATIARRG